MNPNRFVIGERVGYVNHVAGYEIGVLVVSRLKGAKVFATKLFDETREFMFDENGVASWSPNLSIKHLP
jgi:hypothetical protein